MTVKYAGLLLRAAREQAGVKLCEMAEAAGRCHRDLSRMELGARGWRVTPEVVKVYEEVLDMPLAEAVARLTGPDLISSPASGPVSGPGVGCGLAAADAFEVVAEPLRRLVETVHMLVGELRFLRGDGSSHDRVDGKVDVSGGV